MFNGFGRYNHFGRFGGPNKRGAGGGGGSAAIVSVAADGQQATYNGTPPRTYLTSQDWMSGSPVYEPITVTRQGFDTSGNATTYNETIWVTKRLRDPFSLGGNTTDGDNGGGGFIYSTNDVMLSSAIYAGDVIAGATNNSTVASPAPMCWFTSIDQVVVGDSITVDLIAAHRNPNPLNGLPVACVEFLWNDGTIFRSLKVSTMILSDYTGQDHAFPIYRGVLDTAGMANPGKIKVNARVYPWYGRAVDGSVADSSTNTTDRKLFRQQLYRRDTARFASPRIAVVNPGAAFGAFGAGNDTTGVTSTTAATARATPFATIDGAMARLVTDVTTLDGCEIWIAADVTAASSLQTADRRMEIAGPVVRPDPTINRANARITAASGQSRVGASGLDPDAPSAVWHLVGLDIILAGTVSAALSAPFYNWRDCNVDLNARTATTYGTNTTGGNYHCSRKFNGDFSAYSCNTGNACYYIGATITPQATRSLNLSVRAVIGSTINGIAGQVYPSGVSAGQIHWYTAYVRDGSSATFSMTGNNMAVVGCYIERHTSPSGVNVGVSADDAAAGASNLIVLNSTFIGQDDNGRMNSFYDDTDNVPRSSFNGTIAGNTLTVTTTPTVPIVVGMTICRRTGLTPITEECVITAFGTGTGGTGTYTISGSPQTISVARTFNVAVVTDTAARVHGLCAFKGNVLEARQATKGDIFVGANPHTYSLTLAQCAARQGNRAYSHGVDFADNVICWATGFFRDYMGINTVHPAYGPTWPGTGLAGAARITADSQYTNWQAQVATAGAPTNGAGGGTYTLTGGHPGINRCQGRLYTPFDYAGNARVANTNNSAGAYR